MHLRAATRIRKHESDYDRETRAQNESTHARTRQMKGQAHRQTDRKPDCKFSAEQTDR